MNGRRGFTLLELLVAITVLSIAAGGFLNSARHGIRQQEALEKRSFALWMAQNRLAELHAAHAWPDLGESSERVSFAGREWNILSLVAATPNPDMRSVTLKVENEDVALSLTGFAGRY